MSAKLGQGEMRVAGCEVRVESASCELINASLNNHFEVKPHAPFPGFHFSKRYNCNAKSLERVSSLISNIRKTCP